MPAYIGFSSEGASTQAEVRVSYWNECAAEGMRFDFAEMAVHCFKDGGCSIREIPSIADQHVFVTAEVAKVEENVPSSGGLENEERGVIIKPAVIVEDNEEN